MYVQHVLVVPDLCRMEFNQVTQAAASAVVISDWRSGEPFLLGFIGTNCGRSCCVSRSREMRHSQWVSAGLLADQCRSTNSVSDIDLLVPAPLHWTRRLVRGGGCPELLVESMSKALRIPAANGFLRCCRKTKKQGTLLPTERRRNVRHAYRASKAYNVTGAHVLMVDDVMTTGATANEMARVLRKSGATTITLAVVARGIGFDGQ